MVGMGLEVGGERRIDWFSGKRGEVLVGMLYRGIERGCIYVLCVVGFPIVYPKTWFFGC